MIDVVCVHIGNKYSVDYVMNLQHSVARYLSVEHNFSVITDNPEIFENTTINVISAPPWDDLKSTDSAWWFKMYMFSPDTGFKNTVLYFDLDVVVVNSLNKFIKSDNKFWICQDFNRQFVPNYRISNSSVMCWHAPNYHWLYTNFVQKKDDIVKKHRGDQDFISAEFNSRDDKHWWPREWAMSYKWEILHGGLKKPNTTDYVSPDKSYIIPPDTSVVIYHGKPDPLETDLGCEHFFMDITKIVE